MADNNEYPNSIVIGEGVQAKGTFRVPGRAIINGSVEGELIAKDIFVGPTGKAVGKFKAEVADVRGEMHDTIVTTQSLLIRSTGQVSGAIFYRELEIEKGGEIEGEMSHGSDASDKVIFAQESAAVAKPGVVAKPAVASTSTPAAKG